MRGSLSEKILLLITNDGSISMSEIGKKLGIQRDTVKEYIARLKQDEKIRRVGKTRAGHWEIVKKSTESVGEGAFHNDPV
jgi:ATP-dependent DNA helicase RecG